MVGFVGLVFSYSLLFILHDNNIDVSRHFLFVDTIILVASNMNWRKYYLYRFVVVNFCTYTYIPESVIFS
jgi:hypothetical protein